ncbi:MAG: response regulator transcription factor [Acidimicrobiales bacterium]
MTQLQQGAPPILRLGFVGVATASRIMIVEDHGLLLDSLVAALDNVTDLKVVAAVQSLEAFIDAFSDAEPDVVVTDLDLGGDSGIRVAEHARERTEARVLFMTGRGDKLGVEAAIATGSAGFVSKNAPLGDLVDAIRTVAGGAAVFPAELLQQVIGADATGVGATLTERELEVLSLLAQGRNAAEIAESLVVSVHTARNHVRAILSKIHARSQLEAVVIGVREGLVQIT